MTLHKPAVPKVVEKRREKGNLTGHSVSGNGRIAHNSTVPVSSETV